MAQANFGEYAAFTTRGGIRFQKNKKMVSENALPPEVVVFLKDKLLQEPDDTPTDTPTEQKPEKKFPRPSEEEIARMKAESLQVPEHLRISPEEEAQRAVTGIPNNEAPLEPEDFDAPDSSGDQPLPKSISSDIPDEPVALPEVSPENLLLPEAEPSREPTRAMQIAQSDFLESVSIHTAPLEALAQALFDRFGIYSVYLRKLPAGDEVNPLTGMQFTKYHQGIAYQAALFAESQGVLNRDPELGRKSLDQSASASENFQESFQPVAYTLGEARKQNSFAYRTSTQGNRDVAQTRIVHVTDPATGEVSAIQQEIPAEEQQVEGSGAGSRWSEDDEQRIVEPPIFGTKPIIRPNW